MSQRDMNKDMEITRKQGKKQHGFIRGRSHKANLKTFYGQITTLGKNNTVELSKAFATVLHGKLKWKRQVVIL